MYVSFETDFMLRGPAISARDARIAAPPRSGFLHLAPGQMLFHQGDSARSIYRVEAGAMRLRRVTETGRQQVIAFGYPGDLIGFPVGGERTCECEALGPARISVISLGIGATDRTCPFLTDAALHEIGKMQEHFMTLSRKSSRQKLASFLNVLLRRAGKADGDGLSVCLPMSRADIADFLGLRTETVSRSFTDLRERGLIALPEAHDVRILDPDGLAALAEADD